MLHIRTPYGDSYVVNAKGFIARENTRQFSGQWKLVGIGRTNRVHITPTKPGCKIVPIPPVYLSFAEITPEALKGLQLSYKNGNPRYTVHDLDHGTRRVWGNTKYHGIAAIWFD